MEKVKVFKEVKTTYLCYCPKCGFALYDNKPLDTFVLCDNCDTEFETSESE